MITPLRTVHPPGWRRPAAPSTGALELGLSPVFPLLVRDNEGFTEGSGNQPEDPREEKEPSTPALQRSTVTRQSTQEEPPPP